MELIYHNYIQGVLYFALAGVLAYGMVRSNRFVESLNRHFETLETAFVIPLCGEDYKENAQLAREMGHSQIAEKIEKISGETYDELCKESVLEGRLSQEQ